jgi:hypothetical protein
MHDGTDRRPSDRWANYPMGGAVIINALVFPLVRDANGAPVFVPHKSGRMIFFTTRKVNWLEGVGAVHARNKALAHRSSMPPAGFDLQEPGGGGGTNPVMDTAEALYQALREGEDVSRLRYAAPTHAAMYVLVCTPRKPDDILPSYAPELRVWGMYSTSEGGVSKYVPRIFHKFAGKEAGPGGAGRAFCGLDTLASDLTAYLADLKPEGDEEGSMHESSEFASASEGGD